MTNLSPKLKFFLNLAKIHSVITRKFDSALRGIGLTDFIILYHLSQARDEKLRRSDLAEKAGLTASGITRLLAPMEKIGLVKRETDQSDARVSYVVLGKGGKARLMESLDDAEILSDNLLPITNAKNLKEASELMMTLGATL